MMSILKQAMMLGIDTSIIHMIQDDSNDYHYYDVYTDSIYINTLASRCSIEDVVHEYVHHIQATTMGTHILIDELDIEYGKRVHEIHASLVEEAYDTFTTSTGILDTDAIVDYYYDIAAILG